MHSATTTPSWLRPTCFTRTMPCPGREAEGRAPRTSEDEYRVSPWKSGCGKATSSKPRFATMVPWVSWATDAPTMVERVNMEFTSRRPKGWRPDHAASRCRDWVFMVRVVNSTLSASVTVRPGACS